MTPAQQRTLQQLEREGFRKLAEGREIVRVTRNGDNRVIMRDGSQKRGHHVAPVALAGRSIKQRR